ERLLALVQPGDEVGALGVVLAEGQPVEVHAVGPGAVQLPQGDLPLGAVNHLVGDAGLPAAPPVPRPAPGQVEVGVDQTLVAALADAEVDGYDAVVDLADAAEVLPVHAGGPGALLEHAGLVDDPDGAQLVAGQATQHPGGVALELVADGGEVPEVVREELLESAGGCAGPQ